MGAITRLRWHYWHAPHLTCHPAQVFVKAPMVLELSVKDTLEPRAAFLRKTLRLPADALGKLIVRHPQVRLLYSWRAGEGV